MLDICTLMNYLNLYITFSIKSYKKFALLTAMLFLGYFSQAQNISEFQKGFQIHIQPTTDKIKIDGILDEPVWATTDVAKKFCEKISQ